MAKKNNVTYKDIADLTGLSKATISRYFNNPRYLNKENQLTVERAIKALNYQSNKLASVFAKGKTELIGIILPSFFNNFYSFFLNYILSTYEETGYKFIVLLDNNNAQSEKQCIEELLSYKVEGLLILSHNQSSHYLSNLGIPVVAIEREAEFINSVSTNNYYGAKIATEKLIADHCEVLIHINNNVEKSVPAYGRIDGFVSTCKLHDAAHILILDDFTDHFQETYDKLHAIYLTIKEKYPGIKKGIFASNDTLCNILVNILVQNGEKIPEEYELIGFDNAPIAEQSILPLTTVHQDIAVMAHCAIQLLREQVNHQSNDRTSPPSHVVCQPSLVLRKTTAE